MFTSDYPRLVRAAYIIQAGIQNRSLRWRLAHRIAAAALPLVAQKAKDERAAYEDLLARVIRKALRARRFPTFLVGRAATPHGSTNHDTIEQRLVRVNPAARAAFFLLAAEGMEPGQARKLLRKTGIANADEAVQAALRLQKELQIPATDQRSALCAVAMTPSAAWLSPPIPLTIRACRLSRVAMAVVILALPGLFLLRSGTQFAAAPAAVAQAAVIVSKAGNDLWRQSSRASILLWPARGSRAGDEELVKRAAQQWKTTATARLIFAGDLGGGIIVLLTNGFEIARYSERDGGLSVSQLIADDLYGASVIGIGQEMYLTAPWVTKLESAPMGGAFQNVSIVDGVAIVQVPAGSGDCLPGPVMRVTTAGIGSEATFTLGQLPQGQPTHFMYLPPAIAGNVLRPHEVDARGGPEAFGAVACAAGPLAGQPARSLTVWEFWAGNLPEGKGKLMCIRADRLDAHNAMAVVLSTQDGAALTLGMQSDSRLCSREAQDVAAVTWWQAPSGNWFLLAATSRQVPSLRMDFAGQSKTGQGLVFFGPFKARVAGLPVVSTPGSANPVPVVTQSGMA